MKLQGIIPAIITPFKAKGEFDEDAQRENLNFLVKNGVHGLMVNGTTGEAESLSRDCGARCLAGVPCEGGPSRSRYQRNR